MKKFLKTLLHAAVSSALVGATAAVTSGAPITSGNVLFPALVAGAAGAVHAALPSTVADATADAMPRPTAKFPSSK